MNRFFHRLTLVAIIPKHYTDKSMEINYTKGDATNPTEKGNKIIVHICNDIGGWGKGFVRAKSKRWKQPEQQYREWFKTKDYFNLGQVQFVQVEEELWVANLIGQHKINKDENGNAPIRYESILLGLEKVENLQWTKKRLFICQELVMDLQVELGTK
jgi:hypothetical protein